MNTIGSEPADGNSRRAATVHAQRLAEEALQQYPAWLPAALAEIGDGVISTNAEGDVVLMNHIAESLTGWTSSQAVGRSFGEVFCDASDFSESAVVRALATERVIARNGAVLVHRDGTKLTVDCAAAPVRERDTLCGAVVVFRDVTGRDEASHAQARLAAIVESSDDAIVSKSLDGIVQSWNSGAERLFGYTASEVIGRSITIIIPPDRHDEERQILARIASGQPVDHFETVRVARDGSLLDVSLTVSPVRDHTGRIVGASKIARDISERKRSEDALRAADARKDQFIALLAHELRNPLAPLRNGLQVMRLAGNDPTAVAQARGMMERQLSHMVRLIDDLLDISRINQNRMELRRSRVLLADVVGSAVETVRPIMETCRHQFTVSLPTDPIYLDADLTRLAQVFSNLLTNSARYTPPGGEIRLTAERGPESLVVTVRDSGIGIPATAIRRIFDMFSQVDRTHERTSGGLGIGLALVQGLVEMHGGTVTAASPGEGKGSVFTVTLPLSESQVDMLPRTNGESADLKFGARRRILVADDNRDAALSLAMLLKLMGHDVTTAHDGVEAVEIAQAYRPHAIFMDIGMPRLNGYDATRQIREQPWGQNVRIIALTGWGQESDRAQSRAAGCDDHVVKPVSAEDLQQVLKADDE